MDRRNENILLDIQNGYSKLTVSEKKLADYVLSHKTKVQYMSISEFAEECGIAEATISRFCRHLKQRSYYDFKLSLARTETADMNALSQPAGVVDENFAAFDDPNGNILKELYDVHVEALAQTVSFLNMDEVKRAVDYIMSADRIYCMGQSASMILALEAVHLMSTISDKFIAIQDSHSQASMAALMDEKDVILFFSYSGSTIEIVDTIKLARKNRAKVILITRFLKSPGAKISDVVLQCGSNEGPLQMGSVPAKIAQLFVADVLYTEICRRDPVTAKSNKALIAAALADKHL